MDYQKQSPAVVAIIPAWSNAGTLKPLLEQIAEYPLDIIVVNNGSPDDTSAVVHSTFVTHSIESAGKKGKGDALRAGFTRAYEQGYSHAITLDSDSRHLPEDIPVILKKIKENPETLWVGNRIIDEEKDNRSLQNRVRNNFDSLWYKFNTGNTIDDPHCGFRAYPLQLIKDIECKGTGNEFEIEMLTYAVWNGITVSQIPVHSVPFDSGKGVPHFRTMIDYFRASRTKFKASLIRIFLPWRTIHAPGKSAKEKLIHLVKSELKAHSTPRRAAASLALGVFMSLFPILGFQVLTVMALAFIFKLNRPLAFLGVSLSSPPMLPFLIALAIGIGKLIVPPDIVQLSINARAATFFQYGIEWFIGSIILSIAAGIVTFILAYPAFSKIRQARGQMKEGRNNILN
ncbi:MAG: DUF2062 domain-containing protein [Chitinivibrionales bacterium]|nr:DUF2062 domain-containing protein [Chitinivibrionales bacterium]